MLAARCPPGHLLTSPPPQQGRGKNEMKNLCTKMKTGRWFTKYHNGQNIPNLGKINLMYCHLKYIYLVRGKGLPWAPSFPDSTSPPHSQIFSHLLQEELAELFLTLFFFPSLPGSVLPFLDFDPYIDTYIQLSLLCAVLGVFLLISVPRDLRKTELWRLVSAYQ